MWGTQEAELGFLTFLPAHTPLVCIALAPAVVRPFARSRPRSWDEGTATPSRVGPGWILKVSNLQVRSPPLQARALSEGRSPGRVGRAGGYIGSVTERPRLRTGVFCLRRCHGPAPLCARAALRAGAGPGAVRAVASSRSHGVAWDGPGTGDPGAGVPGAGECPGGPGAPGVTLYCKFLQIQR